MKDVGEPCAGEPHARFDGRGLETERYRVTAPVPDPTATAVTAGLVSQYDERDAVVAATMAIKALGTSHHETAAQVEAAMKLIYDAANKTGTAYSNLAQGNNATIVMLESLERHMLKGSPLYNALAAYIKLLLQIPGKINTTIDVNGHPVSGAPANAYLAKTHPTALGGRVPALAGNAYSDSMLQPVSGGEYVVNAAATARPGALAALDAINRGCRPGGGGNTLELALLH